LTANTSKKSEESENGEEIEKNEESQKNEEVNEKQAASNVSQNTDEGERLQEETAPKNENQ